MRLVLLGSIHPQIARIAMGYNADQQMETQELKAESNACASLFLGRLPVVSLVDTCKYQIEPVLTVVIRFDYYPFAFLQSSRKRFLQFRCRSSSWSCKRNIHGEKLEKVPCWAQAKQGWPPFVMLISSWTSSWTSSSTSAPSRPFWCSRATPRIGPLHLEWSAIGGKYGNYERGYPRF